MKTGEFELKEFSEAFMFGFLFVFVQTIRTWYQTMLGYLIYVHYVYIHMFICIFMFNADSMYL